MPPKVERCVTDFMSNPRNVQKWPDEDKRRSAAYAICNAAIQGGDLRGYIIDLSDSIELVDGEKPTWVHLLPYGEYDHPTFGTINIDDSKVNHFIRNFKKNVRGIMLDIDFSHKSDPAKGHKAAGWIIQLDKRDTGLWGLVSWTGEARKEIVDGAWKYMSVEYQDEWTDSQGTVHEDVLLGAGLTNRPYMKTLSPINFSELDFDLEEEDDMKAHTELAEDDPEFIDPADYETKAFRDIPVSERRQHPASDFAGAGMSFPIFKCEDVTAAFHALGLTSQNRDQVRSRIISIARRKGFTRCLPESVRADEFLAGLERRALDVRQEEFLRRLDEVRR